MASIERTAYPRFPRTLTLKDLQASFTPRPEDIEWAQGFARTAERRLALLVNLKCFQSLRHFPAVEAVPAEVIEHVLKAGLSVQADTVYSDTHGQSEAVFAFTYLNGIQLMPRIRNWKDLRFYKAEKGSRYKHIDRLFSDVIDWQLIRNHWKDLMQVAISIQTGRVMSPMLLR